MTKKVGASGKLAPTWWRRVDSNHRSVKQQIYSLSPLATRELLHIQFASRDDGAGGRTRTPDLLITNQLLYQLSYTSTGTCSSAAKISLSDGKRFVKHFFKKGGLFCHKAVWEGERRQRGRFPSGTGSRSPPAFSAPNAARNNIPMTRRRWQGCAPNAAGGTDNERRML